MIEEQRNQIQEFVEEKYRRWQYEEYKTMPDYKGSEEEAAVRDLEGQYTGAAELAHLLGVTVEIHQEDQLKVIVDRINARMPKNLAVAYSWPTTWGPEFQKLSPRERMDIYEALQQREDDDRVLEEIRNSMHIKEYMEGPTLNFGQRPPDWPGIKPVEYLGSDQHGRAYWLADNKHVYRITDPGSRDQTTTWIASENAFRATGAKKYEVTR